MMELILYFSRLRVGRLVSGPDLILFCCFVTPDPQRFLRYPGIETDNFGLNPLRIYRVCVALHQCLDVDMYVSRCALKVANHQYEDRQCPQHSTESMRRANLLKSRLLPDGLTRFG